MKYLESFKDLLVRKLIECGYTIKSSVYYTDTTYILIDDSKMTVEGISTTNPEKFREFKELKESLNKLNYE